MDLGALSPARALDALVSAWAEAQVSEAGKGDTTPLPGAPQAATAPVGFAPEGLPQALALIADAAPEATATLPDNADLGPQTGVLQHFGRSQAPVADALRPTDTPTAVADPGAADTTLPTDQLVQMMLTGLQVEAAAAWPLLRQAPLVPIPAAPRRDEAAHERIERRADDTRQAEAEPPPADDEAEAAKTAGDADTPAAPALDEPADTDWCEPLTRALRSALAAKVPPRELLIAAEQWQRGRCVVLACPQGDAPDGPAWAFVLWPRARTDRDERLALHGLRVEARLLWSTPPRELQWCHVRVVKEHHPRRGRQLVAMDAGGPSGSVPCEVQLGPVLARSLRWCEVCVRIDAVRRFWTALGAQWSASVVVCSRPLLAGATGDTPFVEVLR